MYSEYKPIVINPSFTKYDVIEIIEICDPHIGNECFDSARFNKLIEYIIAEPNRFVIWNGDLMENAVPNSKSDPLTQTMSPQEQMDYVTGLFKLLKDRTLVITDGNHEHNRSTKMAGLYPLYTSACIAGIEDKYRSAFAVVDIGVGDKSGRHIGRCHRFVGYVSHKIKELKNWSTTDMLEGFDFVFGAHDHEPRDHSRGKLTYCRSNRTLSQTTVEMIVNSGNLFYGGYSAHSGARVKSDKMYKLICYGDRPEKAIETLGFRI